MNIFFSKNKTTLTVIRCIIRRQIDNRGILKREVGIKKKYMGTLNKPAEHFIDKLP